nr:hypothetical protein [Tanacetum cinerariifolium]
MFPVSLTGAANRWLRNHPSGLITTWEFLKEKFLNKYSPPARTAKKVEEINNFQKLSCFIMGTMFQLDKSWIQKSKSTKTSDGLAAIQAQLNNLRREIKKVNEKVYGAQVGCELCKGPHYTKDCPQKEEGKTLEEAYYTQLGTPYQLRGQYRAVGPGFYQWNNGNSSIGKFVFLIDFIILDIPEDDDVPLIIERPFLSTAHSKIDVFKRKITLRVGEEKLVFKSIKPAISIIKRVFMLKNIDLKTELIGEGDESLDPMYGTIRRILRFGIRRIDPCTVDLAETMICPPARTAKKVEEINKFQQEPVESPFRAWERFKELLMKCPQHYLTDMQEVILFYNGHDVPTRLIQDSKGAIHSKIAADVKVTVKEMAKFSQNGTREHHLSLEVGCELSRDLTIQKIVYKRKKAKLLKKLTIHSSVQPINLEDNIEQQGHDSTNGTMETILPFPRRLYNYCCDDLKEARGVKILDAYNHNLPQKEKDPGSFTLPYFINNVCFDKALVDLGASVSVMPFSTYTNLGLGILSHIRLTIELADRTIKQPRGIAKNVLVRIGKFVFPVDFIILDIPEDDDVPLIIG